MKIEFISFTMENGEPNKKRQIYRLQRGCSLSIVQSESDVPKITPYKITRTGFLKFKLEVKSDNYREFESKEKNK